MKRAVIAFTCLEKIFLGVLPGQLMQPLIAVKSMTSAELIAVSVIPVHQWLRYRRENRKTKNRLADHKVRYICLPLIYWNPDIYIPVINLPLLLLQSIPLLLLLAVRFKANIHARSYPAGLIAAIVCRILGRKWIFDMRGLYVEEAELTGRFQIGKINARTWKRLEGWLIAYAASVFCVSKPFRDVIFSKYGKSPVVIPCAVDTDRFGQRVHRDERRKELKLSDNFVAVYSGSIGLWTSASMIMTLFKKIQEVAPESRLLVLTQTRAITALKPFEKLGSDVKILHLKPDALSEWICIADMALLPRKECIVNHVAFPVKFGEYLAAGLPVLVTRSVTALADITEANRLGEVVGDVDDPHIFKAVKRLISHQRQHSTDGEAYAESELSVRKIGRKWLEQYQDVFWT